MTSIQSSNNNGLTHRMPIPNNIRPRIELADALNRIDEITSKGTTILEACRQVMASGLVIGSRGSPYKSPESLGATVSQTRTTIAIRNRLNRAGNKRVKNTAANRTSIDLRSAGRLASEELEKLRNNIRMISNMDIDDKTKLTVIKGMVG